MIKFRCPNPRCRRLIFEWKEHEENWECGWCGHKEPLGFQPERVVRGSIPEPWECKTRKELYCYYGRSLPSWGGNCGECGKEVLKGERMWEGWEGDWSPYGCLNCFPEGACLHLLPKDHRALFEQEIECRKKLAGILGEDYEKAIDSYG